MNLRDIDNKINEYVREKRLLNKSLKRAKSADEIRSIKKRIIELNGLINTERLKYNEIEEGIVVNRG